MRPMTERSVVCASCVIASSKLLEPYAELSAKAELSAQDRALSSRY